MNREQLALLVSGCILLIALATLFFGSNLEDNAYCKKTIVTVGEIASMFGALLVFFSFLAVLSTIPSGAVKP